MNSGNEGGQSKHPQEHLDDDANVTDKGEIGEISLRQRSSNSPSHLGEPVNKGDTVTQTQTQTQNDKSLSSSSSEELFQVDTSTFNPRSSVSFSLKPNKDSKPTSSNGGIRTPSTAPADITHKPSLSSMSPTQTPPVQMMDRSEGYDPSRIPSNVFESKPTTPMDWSVASNDSLFSLNVGSYSFSREQFLYGDLGKSGDFDRPSREIGKHEDLHGKSSEFIMFSPPTQMQSPLSLSEMGRQSVEITRNPEASVSGIVEDSTRKTAEKRNQNKGEEKIRAQPVHLNSDGNCSSRSFAFPILTEPTKSGALKEDVVKQKTPPPPQQQLPPQQPPPTQQQQQQQPQPPQQQTETPGPVARPKSSGYKGFRCFYCCCCCRSS